VRRAHLLPAAAGLGHKPPWFPAPAVGRGLRAAQAGGQRGLEPLHRCQLALTQWPEGGRRPDEWVGAEDLATGPGLDLLDAARR
jgi:hypothetical protein